MFKVNISVPIDNTKQLRQALAALVKKEILVGFPSGGDERAEPGMSNPEIAFLNDRGSPAQSIPARPFMEPGIESAEEGIVQGMQDAALAAFEGRPEGMDAGFHKAGLSAQMGIKNTITAGLEPPLSPVSIMLRRRAGFRGTKPLIRTGQLLNAVTYLVRDRK